MSRFKIIFLLFVMVSIVVGIFIFLHIASFSSVSFILKEPVVGSVYKVVGDKKEQQPQTIGSSVILQYQNGDYCVVPTDKKYSQTPICFTVNDKDMSVDFNPNYSKYYLSELLPSEIGSINVIIQEQYKDVIDNFVLKQGALLGLGEWYGGTLTQKVARSDQGDVYRFLLKKTNGAWGIVAYPQIVFSKFDYPSVPFTVLDTVNRFAGIQGSS